VTVAGGAPGSPVHSGQFMRGGLAPALGGGLVALQVGDERLLVVALAPLVEVHEVFDGQARQPAGGFQLGLGVEVAHVAHAQVGDGGDALGNAQRLLQVGLVEE
jgi:hypothetical protein